MRKIKELLRVVLEKNISCNQAALSIGIARSAAQEYLRRAIVNKVIIEFSNNASEAELEKVMYQAPSNDAMRGINLVDVNHLNSYIFKSEFLRQLNPSANKKFDK